MDINPIAAAVPAFFLMIGLEWAWSRARGQPVYRLNDALTDLSCGMSSQAAGLFFVAAAALAYDAVFRNFAWIALPADAAWVWVGSFVLLDLLYYLWHRASHRVNLLWAAHVVHHQSEDYNLAVALRQAFFTSLTTLPFYLPLALLGVPTHIWALCLALNTLGQFWIHTRLVGRLGPLEWVLNTPSHHRVHHGINPSCIDRNHAGIFIVWDRLLGTFAPEPDEEPVYGTVSPLHSWNPIWANFATWVHLWKLSRSCTRWSDRLYAWVAPPEWRPAEQGGPVTIPEVHRQGRPLWDSQPWRGAQAYVLASWPAAALAIGLVVQFQASLTLGARLAAVTLFLVTVAVWGALLERRRWGLLLETGRLLALTALVGGLAWTGSLSLAAAVLALALLFLSAVGLGAIARGAGAEARA